jgi:hypothetical protein
VYFVIVVAFDPYVSSMFGNKMHKDLQSPSNKPPFLPCVDPIDLARAKTVGLRKVPISMEVPEDLLTVGRKLVFSD